MLLLAMDTAGPVCAAAVARAEMADFELLARMEEGIGRGHAERLMPMVDAVLARAGVSLGDLHRIAITTGPGSFTGVRIGIAAARGLALALEIDAIGIGSLDALMFPLMTEGHRGTGVAVLDAHRGEVFALARDLASGGTLLQAGAYGIHTLTARLSASTPPLVLTGAGAPLIAPALNGMAFEVNGAPEAPDIGDVALLASRSSFSAAPVPVYARDADAKPQLDKALERR